MSAKLLSAVLTKRAAAKTAAVASTEGGKPAVRTHVGGRWPDVMNKEHADTAPIRVSTSTAEAPETPWKATKDFASGFAQNPMKWDKAHVLTAGGVALGSAALLTHLLRKKKTRKTAADFTGEKVPAGFAEGMAAADKRSLDLAKSQANLAKGVGVNASAPKPLHVPVAPPVGSPAWRNAQKLKTGTRPVAQKGREVGQSVPKPTPVYTPVAAPVGSPAWRNAQKKHNSAAGVIAPKPATNMKVKTPLPKPKTTTVSGNAMGKVATVPAVLKNMWTGVKAHPKAAIGAGVLGAGAIGAGVAAAKPEPTFMGQVGEQAGKAWDATKEFAGGFNKDPREWDLAHGLTAGGVALGGAALLAHLLRKKRKPQVEEQELAGA